MKKAILTLIPVILIAAIVVLYFEGNADFKNTSNKTPSLLSEERINEIFQLSDSAKTYLIVDKYGCQSCFYDTINFNNRHKIDDLFIITSEKQFSLIQSIAKKNNYELITYPSNEYISLISNNGSPILIKRSNPNTKVFINNQPSKIFELLETALLNP